MSPETVGNGGSDAIKRNTLHYLIKATGQYHIVYVLGVIYLKTMKKYFFIRSYNEISSGTCGYNNLGLNNRLIRNIV